LKRLLLLLLLKDLAVLQERQQEKYVEEAEDREEKEEEEGMGREWEEGVWAEAKVEGEETRGSKLHGLARRESGWLLQAQTGSREAYCE